MEIFPSHRMGSLIQDKAVTCSECGHTTLMMDAETGELVCQKCGMVTPTTNLDTGPEWRAYTPNQKENLPRTGAPINWSIHDKGLSTTIGYMNRDPSISRLNPESRARLYRMRKWHQRSKITDSTNRNLHQALSEIHKISNLLNLPTNIVETSSVLYREALKANHIRGRSIQGLSATCVYIACRQCGVVRTLEDIANTINVSKKDIARDYRFLYNALKPTIPPSDPKRYLGKIINNLRLSGESERLATMILYKANEQKLTNGRAPAGLAAACIYISTRITREHRIQEDIARQAQVTEVTIRNRYKELVRKLDIIIPL